MSIRVRHCFFFMYNVFSEVDLENTNKSTSCSFAASHTSISPPPPVVAAQVLSKDDDEVWAVPPQPTAMNTSIHTSPGSV